MRVLSGGDSNSTTNGFSALTYAQVFGICPYDFLMTSALRSEHGLKKYSALWVCDAGLDDRLGNHVRTRAETGPCQLGHVDGAGLDRKSHV